MLRKSQEESVLDHSSSCRIGKDLICEKVGLPQPFILSGSTKSSELESDVCYRVYGWRHLVKATELTAGLAESNGSLHVC